MAGCRAAIAGPRRGGPGVDITLRYRTHAFPGGLPKARGRKKSGCQLGQLAGAHMLDTWIPLSMPLKFSCQLISKLMNANGPTI